MNAKSIMQILKPDSDKKINCKLINQIIFYKSYNGIDEISAIKIGEALSKLTQL